MKDVTKRSSYRETPAEVAAYRDAADSATAINIRLISSQFELKPEGLQIDKSQWSHGYSCASESAEYNSQKRMLTVLVEAEAFCKVGKKKVISAKCKYMVAYSIVGSPEHEAALRFGKHVGRFAAYPYFRAHFSEMTAQAGLFIPPLPVMNEGKRIIGKMADDPVAIP